MSQLRLFGHPILQREGAAQAIGLPPKAVALLALLAANASRPLLRDWAAQKLWPDLDPAEGRANLRRHLHLISKALGDDALLLARQTLQWNAHSTVEVDVVSFDALAQSQPAAALEQYAGELCAGLDDEVLDDLRLRYTHAYEDALMRACARARADGDSTALAHLLQRALAHDPLDEAAVRELMALQNAMGDRAGALRAYNELAASLHRELETAPSTQTVAAFEAVLYDAGASGVPTNIVAPATSLVGREQEIAAANALLARHRLVSIAGPGGIGKSRLAVAAAINNLQHFPDGVWLVELADAKNEASVVEHVTAAMGGGSARGRAAMLDAIGKKKALLVLDNCDHVHEIARDLCSAIVEQTQTSVFVTSRRKLGISGECVLELQGLIVPPRGTSSSEAARKYSSVRLFMERACIAAPNLRLTDGNAGTISDIAGRLEGIPLAIELVAARSGMLDVEAMSKRLASSLAIVSRSSSARGSASRHATMEQALRWSYDLLSPRERTLFRRLHVFSGRWDIDACEAVCGDEELPVQEVFGALSELIDASLVTTRAGENAVRYELLQPVRQFSQSLCPTRDEIEILQTRHTNYFIDLARRHDSESQDGDRYLRAMISAEPDLQAVLDRIGTANDLSAAAALLVPLSPYWGRGAHSERVVRLMDRLLEPQNLDTFDTHTQAQILRAAGRFAFGRGEWMEAARLDESAAQRFDRAGDVYQALLSRHAQNIALSNTASPLSECIEAHETLLAQILESGVGPAWTAAGVEADLSAMHHRLGDNRRALEYALSALAVFRTHGREDQAGKILSILTRIHGALGYTEEALECAREAVRIARSIGERGTLGEMLRNFALAQMAAGAPAEAVFTTLAESVEFQSRMLEPRFTLFVASTSFEAFAKYGYFREAARALGLTLRLKERANYGRPSDPIPKPHVKTEVEKALGREFEVLVQMGAADSLDALLAALRERLAADGAWEAPRRDTLAV